MSVALLLLVAAFILAVLDMVMSSRYLLPAAVLCIIVAALVGGDVTVTG